jgi:hypothetical protein
LCVEDALERAFVAGIFLIERHPLAGDLLHALQ